MTCDNDPVAKVGQLYSLISELDAIKIETEAMRADNYERYLSDEALAWNGDAF